MTAAAAPAGQHVCDVLVVGSGAGGLATALSAAHLGLTVVVAEKEHLFGGTSARSGGWMWIPCAGPARRAGVDDSFEQARRYLEHEAGEYFDPERIDAFLRAGPEAIAFLENLGLEFDLGGTFADYHTNAPGAVAAGRSIIARPFDGRALGKEIARLRPPLREITLFGMMLGSGKDLAHLFKARRSPVSAIFVAGLFLRLARDLLFHGRPMRLANGNALIGRLAKACFDRQASIWTRAAVVGLLGDAESGVRGAVVDTDRGRVEVTARKGVVLAAGGFPQDVVRRRALFRHAPSGHEHASPAPPGNTGDGLRLGEAVGGSFSADLSDAAAWMPISRPPLPDGGLGYFPHFVDRSKPGVIAVRRSGRRFVNEADSYHDFCKALFTRSLEQGDEPCAFFIADHAAFRRYGLGFAKPRPFPYRRLIQAGYLFSAPTIEGLAEQIGADPQQLVRTVADYNAGAERGEDPAFKRGSTAYNRSLGDPTHGPNPCVAPLHRAPFYAIKVVMGDLGTFAGLRTNANAQVQGEDGRPIDGLYAVGADALSIMGGAYPGGGITLGPAVTFGYIAARHMAGTDRADGPP